MSVFHTNTGCLHHYLACIWYTKKLKSLFSSPLNHVISLGLSYDWVFEHNSGLKCIADIITLGKSIGSGFPLDAVIRTKDTIISLIYYFPIFYIFFTFYKI